VPHIPSPGDEVQVVLTTTLDTLLGFVIAALKDCVEEYCPLPQLDSIVPAYELSVNPVITTGEDVGFGVTVVILLILLVGQYLTLYPSEGVGLAGVKFIVNDAI
jgi:hypothetical protein